MMKTIFSFAVLIMVTACGFQPLHRVETPVAPTDRLANGVSQQRAWMLASLEINMVQGDRSSQVLAQLLEDRLAPYRRGWAPMVGQTLPHRLVIRLEEQNRDLDLRKNDTATRAQKMLIAKTSLLRAQQEQPLWRADLRSVNSYNILPSQYTTYVTDQDARQRGLTDIANQIIMRLQMVPLD